MHIAAVLKVLNAHPEELKTLDPAAGQTLVRLLTQLRDAGGDVDAMIQATEALAALCGQNDVLRPLLSPGVAGLPRILDEGDERAYDQDDLPFLYNETISSLQALAHSHLNQEKKEKEENAE